jgi:hypothetical protein
MPVDKVELAKDLATPEYQTLVKDELSKNNFEIHTKDEHAQFQERFKNDVIEKEIPKKVSEIHSKYDLDAETITGVKRNQDEKSYEYIKRLLKDNNSEALRKERDELKKQVDAGGGKASQEALAEAEKKYQASLAQKDSELNEWKNKFGTTQRESILTRDYAEIKATFKRNAKGELEVPPMFDITEKAVLNEILSSAIAGQDGQLYMNDGQGGIKKDAAFNPISVKSHLRDTFKALIDTGTPPKGGAGSGGTKKDGVDPSTITADNFILPTGLKDGRELMDYMLEQGLKRGTTAFDAIWAKFRPQLPDGKGLVAPTPPTPAK